MNVSFTVDSLSDEVTFDMGALAWFDAKGGHFITVDGHAVFIPDSPGGTPGHQMSHAEYHQAILKENKAAEDKTHEGMIARSKTRERYDVDNGTIHAEYRVRHLSDDEVFQHRIQTGGMSHSNHHWVVEERTVRTEGNRKQEGEWQRAGSGHSRHEAMADVGGSDYREAESLHPTHAAIVAHDKVLREAMDREGEAAQRVKSTEYNASDLKWRARQEYSDKLKKIGNTDPKKVKALQDRLNAKYLPLIEKAQNEHAANQEAHQQAITEREKLQSMKPEAVAHVADTTELRAATKAAHRDLVDKALSSGESVPHYAVRVHEGLAEKHGISLAEGQKGSVKAAEKPKSVDPPSLEFEHNGKVYDASHVTSIPEDFLARRSRLSPADARAVVQKGEAIMKERKAHEAHTEIREMEGIIKDPSSSEEQKVSARRIIARHQETLKKLG